MYHWQGKLLTKSVLKICQDGITHHKCSFFIFSLYKLSLSNKLHFSDFLFL